MKPYASYRWLLANAQPAVVAQAPTSSQEEQRAWVRVWLPEPGNQRGRSSVRAEDAHFRDDVRECPSVPLTRYCSADSMRS